MIYFFQGSGEAWKVSRESRWKPHTTHQSGGHWICGTVGQVYYQRFQQQRRRIRQSHPEQCALSTQGVNTGSVLHSENHSDFSLPGCLHPVRSHTKTNAAQNMRILLPQERKTESRPFVQQTACGSTSVQGYGQEKFARYGCRTTKK
jgi:hypothetical protein